MSTASGVIGTLSVLALLQPIAAGSVGAASLSVLVDTPVTTSGASGAQYDIASVTQYFDPSLTNWVAWGDAFSAGATFSGLATCSAFVGGAAGTCIGNHGFGTNDFIRMTLTNPLGVSATLDIDQNDAMGDSFGPQMVLFGTAANAPDVRRYNFPSGPYYAINEGGAFNSLFTAAGNYTFQFSFRNMFGSGSGDAGHAYVYLLADVTPPPAAAPVPEPTSLVMIASGLIGTVHHLRRRGRTPDCRSPRSEHQR